MPSVNVYNREGKVVSSLELDATRFDLPSNPALVHQAVVTEAANARRAIAHTLSRGAVRGGGKKPWRQKGTGRARQGSIRAPQWRGGGVVFGPSNERNFTKMMPKVMRRKAFFTALSERVREGKFVVVDSFDGIELKTKAMGAVLKQLPVATPKMLFVLAKNERNLERAVRNLRTVKSAGTDNVSVASIIAAPTVVISVAGVAALQSQRKLSRLKAKAA